MIKKGLIIFSLFISMCVYSVEKQVNLQEELKKAIFNVDVPKVDELLEVGAQANWAYDTGFTPLTLAKNLYEHPSCFKKNKIDFALIINILLCSIEKADLNCILNNQHTALTWSIVNKKVNAFRSVLLFDGIDVNKKTKYGSPLYLAKQQNDVYMITRLKKLGAHE